MTLLVIAVAMVFAAGLSYKYVITAILCGLPIAYFILMAAPYRRRRLMAFWDPWSDPLGDGFQVIQSLIAVGSGGLIGRGFMAGVQKLFYLPEPHTDFIYAVIGEEFGLLGTTVILACFLVIAWRGFKIAMAAPDRARPESRAPARCIPSCSTSGSRSGRPPTRQDRSPRNRPGST